VGFFLVGVVPSPKKEQLNDLLYARFAAHPAWPKVRPVREECYRDGDAAREPGQQPAACVLASLG
jgi:hypothetical protein